jgi:hypothetical protein
MAASHLDTGKALPDGDSDDDVIDQSAGRRDAAPHANMTDNTAAGTRADAHESLTQEMSGLALECHRDGASSARTDLTKCQNEEDSHGEAGLQQLSHGVTTVAAEKCHVTAPLDLPSRSTSDLACNSRRDNQDASMPRQSPRSSSGQSVGAWPSDSVQQGPCVSDVKQLRRQRSWMDWYMDFARRLLQTLGVVEHKYVSCSARVRVCVRVVYVP